MANTKLARVWQNPQPQTMTGNKKRRRRNPRRASNPHISEIGRMALMSMVGGGAAVGAGALVENKLMKAGIEVATALIIAYGGRYLKFSEATTTPMAAGAIAVALKDGIDYGLQMFGLRHNGTDAGGGVTHLFDQRLKRAKNVSPKQVSVTPAAAQVAAAVAPVAMPAAAIVAMPQPQATASLADYDSYEVDDGSDDVVYANEMGDIVAVQKGAPDAFWGDGAGMGDIVAVNRRY